MRKTFIKLLLITLLITGMCTFSFANTYSNNSIEIEVLPQRRSYDYGDNIGIDINITNKNRYAKLYYKILEVYSGGGFIPLNFDSSEKTVDSLGTSDIEVSLRDFFYHEKTDRDIDSHITFNNGYTSPQNNQVAGSGISKSDNASSGISIDYDARSGISIDNDARSGISIDNNAKSGIDKSNNAKSGIDKDNDAKSGISKNSGYNSPNNDNKTGSGISKKNDYYHKKHTYTIGGHAYELTEAEYDEFQRYRNEKLTGEKIETTPYEKSEQEELDKVKSQINATLLVIVIVLIIAIALIIFIWFIIKSKSRGGYPSLSKFRFFSIILITTLFINFLFNKNTIYAADIYQENVKYNKSITTQVSYANFTCTFRVTIEYYFVNTIVPITNLELDTDSDTLPDYLEVLYLTDLNSDDTDGDGLPDGVEVYRIYTDPLRIDTDNNGVNDSDEDYDKDRLTNIEEKNHGTDYDNIDTDFDNLSDYDEVNGVKSKDGTREYITNPLRDDTDFDGLRDDTEIKLGLNPLNSADGRTKVNQTISQSILPKELTIERPTPISFRGELEGDIDENVSVRLATDNYYDTIRGKIGLPIRIETTYGDDDGLKVVFDISKYSKKKDRIKIFRYDSGNLTMVDRTYVSGNTIVGDVSSGEYVLVDTQVLLQEVNLFID